MRIKGMPEFKVGDIIESPGGGYGLILKVLKTKVHVYWFDNIKYWQADPYVSNELSNLQYCTKIGHSKLGVTLYAKNKNKR